MFKKLWLLLNCPLSQEEKDLLNELKDYGIPYHAQRSYQHEIKNNKNDSPELIKSKIIRNIVLGKLILEGKRYRFYQYGNLEITIDTYEKEIYCIHNCIGHYKFHYKNEKKEWLNKYLHIEELKEKVA